MWVYGNGGGDEVEGHGWKKRKEGKKTKRKQPERRSLGESMFKESFHLCQKRLRNKEKGY